MGKPWVNPVCSSWVVGLRLRKAGDFRTTREPRSDYARILYMTTMPLAEARAQLSKLVDEAVRTHERVEVTRNGRRAAVIMSADDYDSLMETLDILSDAAAMAEIRAFPDPRRR